MSSIKLCDSEDCYQTENDCRIYSVSIWMRQKVEELHITNWFKTPYKDICQDCIDQANVDYPDLFLLDCINNVYINDKYQYNKEKDDIEKVE